MMYLLCSVILIAVSIGCSFLVERAMNEERYYLAVASLVLLILTAIPAGLLLARFTHGG